MMESTMIMQKPLEPPDFFTRAFVISVILSTFWFAVSKSVSSPSRSLFCESISSLIPRLNWPNLSTDPPRASRLSSCLFRRSYCNCWLDLPLVSLSSYSPVGKLLYFWDISESWCEKENFLYYLRSLILLMEKMRECRKCIATKRCQPQLSVSNRSARSYSCR